MKNDTDIIALRQPESVDDALIEIAREGERFQDGPHPAEHWGHLRDLQPHRKRLRHRSAPNHTNKGRAVAENGEADGLQAHSGRSKDLAPTEERKPVAFGHRRHHIHGRRRHAQHRNPRRLIRPRHPDSSIARKNPLAGQPEPQI